MNELKNKIYGALSDPEAPWYGSDLVPLVGDYIEKVEKRIKKLEAKLEKHRWIPVSKRLPENGNCLVLCEGKIYEVNVRISEDEWEDNEGQATLKETAYCDIEHLGGVLIGHDECITHWKPILLP